MKSLNQSVLVVEDDDLIRETIRDMLEMEGISSSIAKNGRDAIEVLRKFGKPSLILLDLMMPIMNGWEFLKIRSSNEDLASIPVVIISAVGDDQLRGLPVEGVMGKPFEIDALLEIVKKYTEFK